MEVVQLTAQADLGEGIDETQKLTESLSDLDNMATKASLEGGRSQA